jgi:hypothetical protein
MQLNILYVLMYSNIYMNLEKLRQSKIGIGRNSLLFFEKGASRSLAQYDKKHSVLVHFT